MTFEVDKRELYNAVEMASHAVAKKTTNPILSGIKIDVKKDRLNVYATDLQTGFHKSIKVESEEEQSFVVDQKIFAEVIRNLPEGVIKITFDNGIVNLESGYSHFKLPTINGDDYPSVIPEVKGSVIELEREKTLGMIEKVIFCALKDTDPLSKNLNTVYWDFREGGYLTLVASDSYRLALSEVHLSDNEMLSSFLLSLKSMEELKVVLTNSKSKKFFVTFDGTRALFGFESDDIELVLNVVDSKFPNYTEIIPQAFKTKMKVSTEEFIKTLKRVSIASGRTEQVRLEIQDNNITMMANSPDVGEAKEILNMEKEGEDILIAYAPKFLREAIEKIQTTEFEFNISGEINPTILKPLEDNSYMYIVMPTRRV